MLKIVIGNKAYSSWSLRGWLACKQSGLAFDEVVVPMFDKDWTTRRTAPDLAPSGGKVPTLWHDDTVVWDSLAIIDYLDGLTGGTRFWPADTAARGLARSMAAEMHSGYTALRSRHGMNVRQIFESAAPDAEVAAELSRIFALWAQARANFGGAQPYLFGDFGAVDIMFAPVCTRIVTYGLPAPRFAQAYVDAIIQHRWMQDWIAAAQEEEWVIEKYERPAGA